VSTTFVLRFAAHRKAALEEPRQHRREHDDGRGSAAGRQAGQERDRIREPVDADDVGGQPGAQRQHGESGGEAAHQPQPIAALIQRPRRQCDRVGPAVRDGEPKLAARGAGNVACPHDQRRA
jgi:hypothetical protein